MKEATLKQAGKVLDLIGQKETPCEQLQKLLGSGLLSDLLDANIDVVDRNAFRQIVGLVALNVYAITVNYDRSVKDSIKAGNYDWSNNAINSKNFSTKQSGMVEVEVELVHFGHDMSTEEVLKELDKRVQRPAKLHELLVIGEKYPDLQREFPIIALGSLWQGPDGRRHCACLLRCGSLRGLSLLWIDDEWGAVCRFAAVSK